MTTINSSIGFVPTPRVSESGSDSSPIQKPQSESNKATAMLNSGFLATLVQMLAGLTKQLTTEKEASSGSISDIEPARAIASLPIGSVDPGKAVATGSPSILSVMPQSRQSGAISSVANPDVAKHAQVEMRDRLLVGMKFPIAATPNGEEPQVSTSVEKLGLTGIPSPASLPEALPSGIGGAQSISFLNEKAVNLLSTPVSATPNITNTESTRIPLQNTRNEKQLMDGPPPIQRNEDQHLAFAPRVLPTTPKPGPTIGRSSHLSALAADDEVAPVVIIERADALPTAPIGENSSDKESAIDKNSAKQTVPAPEKVNGVEPQADQSPKSDAKTTDDHSKMEAKPHQINPAPQKDLPQPVTLQQTDSVHRADVVEEKTSVALPPAMVYGKDIVEQIAKQISQMKTSSSEVKVLLKPASLGEVVLHVAMEDSKVTARIDVSQPTTKPVVEANLPLLRDALVAKGLEVQRLEVLAGAPSLGGEGRGSNSPAPKQNSKRRGFEEESDERATTRVLGYNTVEFIA